MSWTIYYPPTALYSAYALHPDQPAEQHSQRQPAGLHGKAPQQIGAGHHPR
jgi:hypothetical protein